MIKHLKTSGPVELSTIIGVDKDKCVNCHTCISACPVKYCNDGSGDFVKVNPNMCIGCGNCLSRCTHEARYYVDDFDEFQKGLTKGEKMVAIVAPSAAANFPGQYLNLNGWLKDMGMEAVFDVSFGAELAVKSCLEYLDKNRPQAMISQACPAIVTYIELYHPELIQYLIPCDSPMIHTIKMIKRFYPLYKDHKVAVVSPCAAKKREFTETGLGDYNISYAAIDRFLKGKGLSLHNFPRANFDNPPAERAVLFSTPGGFLQTVERRLPGIRHKTRKIEGVPLIYKYLQNLNAVIDAGKNPFLVDCLNCEMGCNGGTLTLARKEANFDEIEFWISQRAREVREFYGGKEIYDDTVSSEKIEETISQYWEDKLYSRTYHDLSKNVRLNYPDKDELAGIYKLMYKYTDKDIYNCTACGYNSCENMAFAIFNHLNRPENCHFYLAKETEISHQNIVKAATRLATIFDASAEGLMQIDKNGVIVVANPAMNNLLLTENLVGHLIFDYLDFDSKTVFRQQSSLYTENIKGAYEMHFVRPDGTTSYCLVSAAAVFDEDQKLLGEFAIVLDITERKRLDALRARQLQLSEAMDLAHVVYWEFDAIEKTFVFNDPFYVFFGTTAGQEGGYRMTSEEYAKRFIHPADLPCYYQFAEQNILRPDHESVVGVEHRIIRRDGEVRHILSRSRIVKDNSGHIVKIHGANQDITERKRAEMALLESEQRYRTVFENTGAATIIIEKDTTISLCNAEFERLSGYSRNEIEGKKSWTEFVVKKHLEHMLTQHRIRREKHGQALNRYEFQFVSRNGEIHNIYLVIDVIHDTEKSVASLIDITALRQLENQLRQAQKTEAIGTLAGGIAHDFNNILTALTGYASLIQMDMDTTDPLRSYVDEVLKASEKAVDLTQSLLTFSRRQAVNLVPLNMNETIKVTEKLLRRLLTEDIEFQTILVDDDMIVMADNSQMDQILFNLVTNARDAMPQGGTLTIGTSVAFIGNAFIKAHGFGEAGKYVRISVSDTGQGMDEITRQKIFDPFFTTKEVGKGTGLGLATVYGIVKQHNGYITVESLPNEGAIFHIYLPYMQVEVDETEDATIPVKRGKETILIAEDNEGVRHFMREALQKQGYTIREAIDGEDAVEKFREHRDADLIIIDSVMPKKNGRETYEEIYGIDPHVKVLFTSGYTKDVVLDKGIEEKEFDFIAKPLSLNKLFQKVREVLDRQ
jgi:PAS domain S-box-containing protein